MENGALNRLSATVPRDRDLSEREVGAFWIATEELPAPWRQALRLLLATGCRMTEVLASREGDYENGDWLTLHGRRRKTNETIRVAIPAIAKTELQSLPAPTDGNYLFSCNDGTSAARGLRKPLDTIVKPKMAELLGEAPDYFDREENHFVIHDLRRTCRTHLSRIGIDPFVAERCLGHAVGKIQATCDRYSYDREKRAAIDRWGDEIERLASDLKAKQ